MYILIFFTNLYANWRKINSRVNTVNNMTSKNSTIHSYMYLGLDFTVDKSQDYLSVISHTYFK